MAIIAALSVQYSNLGIKHFQSRSLHKLVKAGERVAICDQLEDPKTTKTIVKRGVTELVTPGVAMNDQVLEGRSNNFLASIHYNKKTLGIAFLDISTGEFMCSEGNLEYAQKCIALSPTCKISFSGIVTFKNAKDIQNTAQYIPLENILVETDAPYLTPSPYRGKTENEP